MMHSDRQCDTCSCSDGVQMLNGKQHDVCLTALHSGSGGRTARNNQRETDNNMKQLDLGLYLASFFDVCVQDISADVPSLNG